MTATFDPALTTPKDRVRLHIGDTGGLLASGAIPNAEVADETIAAYLTTLTVLRTAETLANSLAAKYAKVGDFTVDDQRNANSKISANYLALAKRLGDLATADEASSSTVTSGGVVVTGLNDFRGPLDYCDPIYYRPPYCGC